MTESNGSHNSLDAVWQSIENMRLLGPSLNSFWGVMDDQLREGEFFASVEQISEKGSATEYGWCSYSEYKIYSLKKRRAKVGRPGFFGDLSVGIELWRKVEEGSSSVWSYSKSPLIYVGFNPKRDDAWNEEQMYLDQHGCPAQDDNICIPEDAPWLCEYRIGDEQDWNTRSWFFAVPLGAIHLREDVQKHIVAPVKALLDGTSPCDAFRDTGVIRHRSG